MLTTDRLGYEYRISGWHWQFSRAVTAALLPYGVDQFIGLKNLGLIMRPLITRGNGSWEMHYKNVPLLFVVEDNRVGVILAGE